MIWAQNRYTDEYQYFEVPDLHQAKAIIHDQHQRYVWAKGGSLGHAMWQRAEQLGLRWVAFEISDDDRKETTYSSTISGLTRFRDLMFDVTVFVPPSWADTFMFCVMNDPYYIAPYSCLDVTKKMVPMRDAKWGDK